MIYAVVLSISAKINHWYPMKRESNLFSNYLVPHLKSKLIFTCQDYSVNVTLLFFSMDSVHVCYACRRLLLDVHVSLHVSVPLIYTPMIHLADFSLASEIRCTTEEQVGHQDFLFFVSIIVKQDILLLTLNKK